MKKCKCCGKKINKDTYWSRNVAKYCDRNCYNKSFMNLNWKGKELIKKCVVCEKTIIRTDFEYYISDKIWERKKFCSGVCQCKYQTLRYKKSGKLSKLKLIKKCVYCNKIMERKLNSSLLSWKKRKYCDMNCYQSWCREHTLVDRIGKRKAYKIINNSAMWLKSRRRINHKWQTYKKKKRKCEYSECKSMTFNKHFCSTKCYWYWRIGRFIRDAHPQWQGGISNRPYDFEFNGALKELIKEMYCSVCQICFRKTKNGHSHHIHYIKTDSRPETLAYLDKNCHMRTNSDRSYWFAYFCHIKGIEPEEVINRIKENGGFKI